MESTEYSSKEDAKQGVKCYLTNLNSLNKVELPSTKTFFGRDSSTDVTSSLCSRQQVTTKVDNLKKQLLVKGSGVHPTGLNGFLLRNDKCYDAVEGDILEPVYGYYPHLITFESNSILPDAKMNIHSDDVNSEDFRWEVALPELHICTFNNPCPSDRIAGYDLDGNIITTKSGNTFAKDAYDWKFWSPEVCSKLRKLYEENYKIVIFTNQLNITIGDSKLKNFKIKLKAILSALKVPCQVFISTMSGLYRKPMIGMWSHLVKECNSSIAIDYDSSFYVGDAAGRPKEGKRKADHSCGDRLFAYNLGLKFYTPEEHFQGKPSFRYEPQAYDPRIKVTSPLLDPEKTVFPLPSKEIILIVGIPGSGKSFFSQNVLAKAGYAIINRDALGSMTQCINLCKSNLRQGKSCVIDNTNLTVESRKTFIGIGSEMGAVCRCFEMNTSLSHIKHNLKFRDIVLNERSRKINDMVFNGLKKSYQKPLMAEGFSEIVKVNCVPKFTDEILEKLYKMFLSEK